MIHRRTCTYQRARNIKFYDVFREIKNIIGKKRQSTKQIIYENFTFCAMKGWAKIRLGCTDSTVNF